MRNRNKYDWSKPFKLIDNKKAFDDLQTNEQNLIINIADDEAEKAAASKKQDIPVPKIELVPKATVIKKFARITPNYIRLPPQLNLPNASSYELTQVDHLFLKSHENKFVFRGKKILTQAFLIKIITELQLKAGKDMTLPRNKGWLMSILEKDYKELLQMENVQNFAQNVYNYWKNRREELKFPLLRLLWRPTPQEYNHMLAFRPREKDKRSLRRTNRVVQDQIVQELYEQFDLALKLVDRIQVRQELKFKQIQLQISSFYTECKNYCSMHDDIDEIKMQQRSKDKQKLKRFHDDIERYKNRKQSLENIKVEDTNSPNIDNKQSIINFLSTVVFEAEALGISHEKIFYSSNSFVDKPKIIAPPLGGNFIPQEVIQEIPQENKVVDEAHLNFSVKKFESKIYRTFSEDQQEIYHVKPCKDYLEYKRRKVDKYYFGSDDEGQVKDLRKIISTSFKKFMQMQQTSKNLPITGQN